MKLRTDGICSRCGAATSWLYYCSACEQALGVDTSTMGFRSTGHCTICGHDTNQHDYLCDGCFRTDEREKLRERLPVFNDVDYSVCEKYIALEKTLEGFVQALNQRVAAKDWAGVESSLKFVRGTEDALNAFVAQLKVYTLQLSYKEMGQLYKYCCGLPEGNTIRQKINKEMDKQ